jgi:putative transposase
MVPAFPGTLLTIARDTDRNVKRWRDGKMALRWIAAGTVEAERQFRRVNVFRDLHILARALECRREVIDEPKHVA